MRISRVAYLLAPPTFGMVPTFRSLLTDEMSGVQWILTNSAPFQANSMPDTGSPDNNNLLQSI